MTGIEIESDDDLFDHELDDAHWRALTLGHELLAWMEFYPNDKLTLDVLALLGQSLNDDYERSLFDLPPLPSGHVVAFRKPLPPKKR